MGLTVFWGWPSRTLHISQLNFAGPSWSSHIVPHFSHSTILLACAITNLPESLKGLLKLRNSYIMIK